MTRYAYRERGSQTDLGEGTIDEAIASARAIVETAVRAGDYGELRGTMRVHGYIVDLDTEQFDPDAISYEAICVEVDPDEPECEDGRQHDWQEISVRGHGGGVICRDECPHCGRVRITDTWDQDRETGEQGLTTVRYED
jgi:hypothetical protein